MLSVPNPLSTEIVYKVESVEDVQGQTPGVSASFSLDFLGMEFWPEYSTMLTGLKPFPEGTASVLNARRWLWNCLSDSRTPGIGARDWREAGLSMFSSEIWNQTRRTHSSPSLIEANEIRVTALQREVARGRRERLWAIEVEILRVHTAQSVASGRLRTCSTVNLHTDASSRVTHSSWRMR